jgi:hypothetical protein
LRGVCGGGIASECRVVARLWAYKHTHTHTHTHTHIKHTSMHIHTELLRKTVGAIEISRDGVLEKAYFIIPSLCTYLTKETKQAQILDCEKNNYYLVYVVSHRHIIFIAYVVIIV